MTEDSGTTAFMATIPTWHNSFARIQMQINHRGQPRVARIQVGDTKFLEVPSDVQVEFNPRLPKDTFSAIKSLNAYERLHNTRTFWGTLIWDEQFAMISVTDWQPMHVFQKDGGETAWESPLDTKKIWPKTLDRCGNPISEAQTKKIQGYLNRMHADRYLRKVRQQDLRQMSSSRAIALTSRVSVPA